MKVTRVTPFLMRAGAPGETAWGGAGQGGMSSGGSRHWCFVRVETDAGISGVGEGSGWPKLVAAGIDDLGHLLLGEDPRDTDRLWHKMFVAQMGHGQTGVVGSGALNALDMALWDIKAKALDVPLWQLLGGAFRKQIPAYAHASTVQTAQAAMAAGYRTLKVGNPRQALGKLSELRQALGSEVDIAVDLHGPPWLAAQDAARLVRKMEAHDPMFVEEPVAPEDLDGLRMVRAKTDVPLAAGERSSLLWGYRTLLSERLVDIIQPDTGRAGGITQLKKIAVLAEANFVSVAPHAGTLGPIAEYAAVHLLAAIPNGLLLERFLSDWPGRQAVITHALELKDGHVVVPHRPGLGVDLVPEVIEQHPPGVNIAVANPNYLSVYEDGTADERLYVQPRRRRAAFFQDPASASNEAGPGKRGDDE